MKFNESVTQVNIVFHKESCTWRQQHLSLHPNRRQLFDRFLARRSANPSLGHGACPQGLHTSGDTTQNRSGMAILLVVEAIAIAQWCFHPSKAEAIRRNRRKLSSVVQPILGLTRRRETHLVNDSPIHAETHREGKAFRG